jgi:membrane associated rhomboid family serine protease
MFQAPRGFSILPTVVKNLIIINVLVYLFFAFSGNYTVSSWMFNHFALFYPIDFNGIYERTYGSAAGFAPWQFITYLFMHDKNSIFHLFFNMFALWMFGSVLENVLGTKRFLNLYLFSGIGAAIVHMFVVFIQLQFSLDANILAPVLGASGAVYGILFTYAYYFPNQHIYVYFLFPVKVKYVMAFLIVTGLISGITSDGNIAHFAHLGGVLSAFIFLNIFRIKRLF